MIHLADLSKRYGNTFAVDGVNLHIPHGEVFGFIGPNGAGKTTTIQMIGGLIAPTLGTVTIDGIRMDQEPEKAKKKIGLIPDRPFLYEKLTGIEFLKFTADLYDVDKYTFSSKAEDLLNMFSLSDRAHELIEAYSHGMKQRLIMSAALLHDPPLIVVDEPMVGLDPRGIDMVKHLFRDLASKGTTVFISTHTLKLAEDVCDRIGIIDKGRVVGIGTLSDLTLVADLEKGDLEQIFFQLTEEETHP